LWTSASERLSLDGSQRDVCRETGPCRFAVGEATKQKPAVPPARRGTPHLAVSAGKEASEKEKVSEEIREANESRGIRLIVGGVCSLVSVEVFY
jgi:hypothetical protein